jgi:ketosteroid isomerase-like protein
MTEHPTSPLEAIRAINTAWQSGDPEAMRPWLDPHITMVFPGFEGRSAGADGFIRGFDEYLQHATPGAFRELDVTADIHEDTAIVTYRFETDYSVKGTRYHSTGRDLWVLRWDGSRWMACWRTMLDVEDREA